MIINLTTPMSDDKERQRRNEVILAAIEQYTEERMNDAYGRIHTDGSRSGGQPVLRPCPFCGSPPKSGDSTYGYWLIFCSDENNCLAQPSVELKTEAEAIAAWNTRQPTQSNANERLGAWLSAALDDPNCSDAFKQDINDWFASQPTQSDALREALADLLHAVCSEKGFAQAVRRDSGRIYPWPALDLAEAKALKALDQSK